MHFCSVIEGKNTILSEISILGGTWEILKILGGSLLGGGGPRDFEILGGTNARGGGLDVLGGWTPRGHYDNLNDTLHI